MIDADRAVFMELLGDLFGAHTRNLTASLAGGYWRGLSRMTLAEFRACVDAAMVKLEHTERGVAKPPSVSELWDTKRNLARTPEARAVAEAVRFPGDHWSVAGNLALLSHIGKNAMRIDPVDYAPDSHYDSKLRQQVHGEHTEAIAAILAKWKNAWVIDMREAEVDGREIEGKAYFGELISKADAQVREYLARYCTRAAA